MSKAPTYLLALLATATILLVLKLGIGYPPPLWLPVVLFIAFMTLVRWPTDRKRKTHVYAGPAWPVSGPIARLGPRTLLFVFSLTSLFAYFNPFQLREFWRQSTGNAAAKRRIRGMPATVSKVRYSLPFHGEWCIARGGVTAETSHSWDIVCQRYAYDVVIADSEWRRHHGNGDRLEHYFCYGREILAAADGVIVSTENRIGAAPFVGFGIVDVFARSLTGNRVIIRHAENEYGFYAHLIKGSVCVSVGEQVRRGQTIGRCGHSGHSSEPHLHFHVQDRENFFAAAGVPILFQDLAIDGEPIDAGQPRGRQRVRTLGATAMLRS